MSEVKAWLQATAEFLGARTDTEWAYENEDRYNVFDAMLNAAWEEGKITDEEFNELALTAFYDYFDLKET